MICSYTVDSVFTTSTEPDGDREQPLVDLVAFSGTCPNLITFAELMELRDQDLPDSLHGKLREFAEAEGLSVERLVASAAAEKLAALLDGAVYLRREAAIASRADFERVLAKAPDASPLPGDEME